MPKPSNLREIVQAAFDERRLNLSRARMLFEAVRSRPVAAPHVREPWDVRVRGMRDSFRKVGNILKAITYEQQLAEAEGREVEEWARGGVPVVEAPKEERPPFKPDTSPSALRAAKLAEAFRAKQDAERRPKPEA
jgi:hypothetical protein